MEMFSLKDKKILLTGGQGFLAQYFIEALEAAGAEVQAPDKADMDVTSQEAVDRYFAAAGPFNVVINNAAIDPKFDPAADQNAKVFENYPEEAFRQSMDVNMLGAWRVAKAAVRQMLEANPSAGSTGSQQASSGQAGNIINISSIYGVSVPHQDIYPEGTQKPVDYGMTKAAVQYLTRYIAGTYGRRGIRSNALVLGGVLKGHDADFVKKYGQYSMLGRMTAPEEIGAPLVFLAADASQGMTGHLLAVDGGFSAW